MAEFIFKVDGVQLPCPSEFEWNLSDISSADSGRTSDMTMHKNRKGMKVNIKVAWNAPDWKKTATIINAFMPEYFSVEYPDPTHYGQTATKEFYRGDISAPVKTWFVGNKRFDKVSFDIIER